MSHRVPTTCVADWGQGLDRHQESPENEPKEAGCAPGASQLVGQKATFPDGQLGDQQGVGTAFVVDVPALMGLVLLLFNKWVKTLNYEGTRTCTKAKRRAVEQSVCYAPLAV